MVQDAWRLCACVRAAIRTYICGSGSGMAAVAIAVDREASDASRVPQTAYRIGTYTRMPYEYNWSQDVEKCTLDLVLSHCTCTNAVQATAVASKELQNDLYRPLSLDPIKPMSRRLARRAGRAVSQSQSRGRAERRSESLGISVRY